MSTMVTVTRTIEAPMLFAGDALTPAALRGWARDELDTLQSEYLAGQPAFDAVLEFRLLATLACSQEQRDKISRFAGFVGVGELDRPPRRIDFGQFVDGTLADPIVLTWAHP